MAGANLPAKKYTKTAPTVIRLSFTGSGGATQFIDIAHALSAINRKFYRQGLYYYVNSVELYNNEDAFVDIHTLPDTWVTKNAWNRGFTNFQKMNSLVDTPRPKYHDFKVYMSDLHRTTGTMQPKLFDVNSQSATVQTDEWAYSRFTSMDDDGDATQDADNFYVHMLGDHVGAPTNWTSVGLIKSYGRSRPLPQSNEPVMPSLPGDGHEDDPILNLFDASSEDALNEIAEILDVDNDATPYDADAYVGQGANNMHHVARLATSVSSGRVAKASGFCVPFGLICVDPQDTATSYRIVVNLAVGTYHGVYAERA
jgi:hypothetical protein